MHIDKRFRNYGLWVSVAALVALIVQDLGVDIAPEHYEQYVNAILQVLVLAGIINNPSTNSKGFLDDREEI